MAINCERNTNANTSRTSGRHEPVRQFEGNAPVGSRGCIARIKHVVNAKHKQPLVGVLPGQPVCSLALRSTAAPGRKVGSGTGFARAAGITPLRHQPVSEGGLVSAHRAIAHGPLPNTTVNRTSNSGLRPLSAAGYLRR